MTVVADFLVAFGGFCAAFYCYLLSRRLKRFTALESGMGSAIAVLSAQVDDMTLALSNAKAASESSAANLGDQVRRAEAAASRIELLLASMHDLPGTAVDAEDMTQDRRIRFVRRRAERPVMGMAE